MFSASTAPAAGVILVVDDEPQIRRAVRNALAPLSERVVEAETGGMGLVLAASARPDLVILDLALPDMEGVDVCRDLRAWSRVPIIVLSARDSEMEKVDLLRAGADDYITKPFGLRELEVRVQMQLPVHMTKLRRKIEPDASNPVLIITEPGVGYRLELPARAP